MMITNLDTADALDYCSRLESHFYDRKAFEIKSAKIQKIAVAFANSDGGEFVVGIADSETEPDPKKRWNGVALIEQFNSHIQALIQITPPLPYRFSFLTSLGMPGFVLLVEVEKSSRVHQTADGTVYTRVSAQSLPVKTQEEAMALTYAKGASSFEEQVVKGAKVEAIVDHSPILEFLADYSPKTDPLDFVVNQHIVDVVTWEPKVAGLLLFAPDPSTIVPRQCAIKIARYETKEDEPEREHLKESVSIEGNLYNQILDAAAKISEIMSSISIWTVEGLKRVDYPPESIWEVLVNAVIHRDYSISDNIHIHIYNNRIEFLSPGRLPGYVTLENILEARYSRNPRIVRTLNRYRNPPNKDMGEGLNTAFQKMKEWKLKDPQLSEDGNYFKVVIPHTSLASPEEAILEFLIKNATIRNAQGRDLTGIRSENAMKNVFYKLRDEGYIERVPGLEGPSSAWRLVKK